MNIDLKSLRREPDEVIAQHKDGIRPEKAQEFRELAEFATHRANDNGPGNLFATAPRSSSRNKNSKAPTIFGFHHDASESSCLITLSNR